MAAGPDNEFSRYDGKVCVLFAIIFELFQYSLTIEKWSARFLEFLVRP